jgi:hypothetical protein
MIDVDSFMLGALSATFFLLLGGQIAHRIIRGKPPIPVPTRKPKQKEPETPPKSKL